MATIEHIDKEKYAAKALEFIENEKDYFARTVCANLLGTVSTEVAREQLVRMVKHRMEDILFRYLKREGIVKGSLRRQYYLGYYRTVRREPNKRDVPSELLDAEKILPNFGEILDAILMEAGRLKMISAIEETTKKAREEQQTIFDD